MPKSVKAQEPAVRDQLLKDFIGTGVNRAAMLRKSNRPDAAMLITRSVFPLMVQELYSLRIGVPFEMTFNAQLERLKCEGVITEFTHSTLRDGATALSEFSSTRDCKVIIQACQHLHEILKHERKEGVRVADREREAKRKAEAPKQSGRFRRFATAAAGLFGLGMSST